MTTDSLVGRQVLVFGNVFGCGREGLATLVGHSPGWLVLRSPGGLERSFRLDTGEISYGNVEPFVFIHPDDLAALKADIAAQQQPPPRAEGMGREGDNSNAT